MSRAELAIVAAWTAGGVAAVFGLVVGAMWLLLTIIRDAEDEEDWG